MTRLAHLQTHSVYSFRHSTLTIPDLVSEVAARGHKAIALTDVNGVYGLVPFVQAAREAGIKPIIGAELSLKVEGLITDRPQRVTLLARNHDGFRNLSRLISQFHLNGRVGVPPMSLLEHAQGLTLMTGGQRGFIPQLVATQQHLEAQRMLALWREAFGEEHTHVQLGPWWPARGLVQLAKAVDVEIVAAQEACYLKPEDAHAWHQLQMGHGKGLPAPGPRHLATDEELFHAWRELPEALANTLRIAEACAYEPIFGVPMLPAFPSHDGVSSDEHLLALCNAGLEMRYGSSEHHSEARHRLAYELDVIRQMGLIDYFLLAWDLVRFAREAGIPHMPRGSAAGSIVLYLLGISQVCPLEHYLCFERFLNPERKGLPDIDIDFDWRRRDEIVDYAYATYGEAYVARIATHQHHGPRGAVRLAGAALGLEEEVIGQVSRRMPGWTGSGDIKSTLATSPECKGLPIEKEPYRSLIDLAQHFEGIPDHLGLHPCGIVISREPLTDVVPLEVSAKGPIVTQFEMHGVEAVGLLKMDLLGNRNLAILNDVVALVNERHGLSLVAEELPLDDPLAFELLRSGRTLGIYQLESGGVQSLLRQFKPTHVEDITAITSLYRPGPIDGGITPRYVARRHGKEPVEYPDPSLSEVLKHTYGCILFQEQCLQVTHVFAGMSMGQSDNLRRGIAKRIRPEVHRIKDEFFAGALRLGRNPETIEKVWELLANFGGYGFVKAHAASCAALAVREAYLKARWPVEYLSVVLSAGFGYYPPRVYIEDARSFGAEIALPCVNRSTSSYTVEGHGVIRVGLSYIKGVGPAGVQAILDGRGDTPFQNLADLRQRTRLSRPDLETLISIGACSTFGASRPGLMWQLTKLGKTKAAPARQASLFSLVEPPPEPPASLGEYPPPQRQQIERQLLGYNVTVTPLPKVVGSISFQQAKVLPLRSKASVTAEIVSWFGHRTKKGEKMCFLTLSDGVSQLQAVLFPEAYRAFSMELRKGAAVFSGYIGDEDGEAILAVTHVEALRLARGA